MPEFLALLLLGAIVGSWAVVPWRTEPVLRLFGVDSDEELMRRVGQFPRFVACGALVMLADAVAITLALVVLL